LVTPGGSTEFYAYLLFSISLFVLNKKIQRLILAIVLILIAAILFKISFEGDYNNAEYGYLRCIFLFIIGVFIEHFSSQRKNIFAQTNLLFLVLSIIVLYFNKNIISSKQVHAIIELGIIPFLFSGIISTTINGNSYLSNILSSNPLQWIGKYSYSIYLNHAIILLVIPKLIFQVLKLDNTPFSAYLILFICIMLTIVYSTLTYKHIERKFYRLHPN
jgi:peptidoglycan/LPS O-acetylase OafA/YrhL